MIDPDDLSIPPTPVDQDTYNLTRLLVLAICGVSVCGLCAPFALASGIKTLERMNADGVYSGTERILANVCRNLGFIGTIALAAVVLWLLMRANIAYNDPYIRRLPYE